MANLKSKPRKQPSGLRIWVILICCLFGVVPIFIGEKFAILWGIYLPLEVPGRIAAIVSAPQIGRNICDIVDTGGEVSPASVGAQRSRVSQSFYWGYTGAESWLSYLGQAREQLQKPPCRSSSGAHLPADWSKVDWLTSFNTIITPYTDVAIGEGACKATCRFELRQSLFVEPSFELLYWPRLCWRGERDQQWIEAFSYKSSFTSSDGDPLADLRRNYPEIDQECGGDIEDLPLPPKASPSHLQR